MYLVFVSLIESAGAFVPYSFIRKYVHSYELTYKPIL